MNTWDIAEVERPAPRDLTGPQLEHRGKRMQSLNNARSAVKSVVQPNDSFTWVEPERPDYDGKTATVAYFHDQWCYITMMHNGKPKTQNIGFARVAKVLRNIGKL